MRPRGLARWRARGNLLGFAPANPGFAVRNWKKKSAACPAACKEQLKVSSKLGRLWEKLVIRLAQSIMNRRGYEGVPMVVLAGDYISLKIMVQGRFEYQEISALERHVFPSLDRNSHCLDIGANIGNHCVAFAPWFATVQALEPNPIVFDVLSLNAKFAGNIVAHQVGASDQEFLATAVLKPGNLGATKITEDKSSEGRTIEFRCVRPDSYLPPAVVDNISFVKIDVEGHEYEVMHGCERILKASHPVVAFELLRKDFDQNGKRVLELLRQHGYDHFYTSSGDGLERIHDFTKRNYKMILAATRPLP